MFSNSNPEDDVRGVVCMHKCMQPNKKTRATTMTTNRKAQHDRKYGIATTINTLSCARTIFSTWNTEQVHNRTTTQNTKCRKCTYLQKYFATTGKTADMYHTQDLQDNSQNMETQHRTTRRFRKRFRKVSRHAC